ncbi:leucine-rich repeat domain-containing protein [Urbifossiella limnaea]|uniref:Leucine-rich repeat domain-containing protein n=1 Tax=Urbifossiella limnaea TaxID=2528023 RepID=A0A517Y1L7_9BACT|nr:hypothetical protein [Urbifossiella limnaea]QDU23650.1 hypothetical protein ETAA1_56550 [Urbifossiella limnaea]
MPARIALLTLLAVVGGGLLRLGADAPRSPDAPRLPELRAATAAEVDAVEAAVRAVGGGLTRRDREASGDVPDLHRRLHTINLGHPVTAEQIDRLPDPDFGYALWVVIDPTTPPGLLARLGRLRHLRRVSVDVRAIPDEPWHMRDGAPPSFAAARVAELAAVPHLEELFLNRGMTEAGFGDDVAAVLQAFPALRAVGTLTGLSDTGAATLARMHRLERLIVGGPGLTDAGFARLSALPRLRDLWVQNRPPLSAASLRPFTLRPRLVRLVVQLDGAEAAEQVSRIHTLEYLSLGMRRREGGVRPELLPLARLPRLRQFQPGEYGSDEEAEVLSRFPALESAVLFRGTDTGLRSLTRIRTLRNLQLLSPAVTDAGLAAVATLPRLETLGVTTGPGVTDAGLDALAAAPRLASLAVGTGASSGRVSYTEAGLRRFVAARGPRLTGLSTSHLGLGDDFVTFLAATAPNLSRLGLGTERGITDASVPALRTLPRLRSLDVGGSSSGRPGLKELEYQVRGVQIVRRSR